MNHIAVCLTESDPIDLRDAMVRVEGNEELLEELLGIFCEDFPERIAQISNAILAKNSATVREVGHSLKGAAANLSLNPIRETSLSLEMAGKDQRLDEAARLVSELEEEFLELEHFLRRRPQPMAEAPRWNRERASVQTGGPHRILAVEDTLESARLLERIAESEGIPLAVAHTGQEALAWFESNPYLLVLLDLNLPDMNGYELLGKIRKIEKEQGRPETPVLALTASVFPEDIERCRKAGFVRFLEKPLRTDLLLRILYEALGENKSPIPAACIDESIADLIPEYLDNRKKDLARIKACLKTNDLGTVESIAHRIKGSGASYGFIRITEISQKVETAARKKNRMELEFWLKSLESYLHSVVAPPHIRPHLGPESILPAGPAI